MLYLHKHPTTICNRRPRLQRNQRRSLNQQRGVVIVIALFIVALVATMSYVMLSRLERDTRRTTLISRNVQAEYIAQGSVVWAIDTLRNNSEQQKPNQLVDRIPIRSAVKVTDGYKVVSTIYDLQSRFNLNNVANNLDAQTQFALLLRAVQPNIPDATAMQIVLAVLDWINPSGRPELAVYYQNLPTPYRPPHKPMAAASELRLVKGMTPTLFNALQPYITALPGTTPLNVQTADLPVLMTLSPVLKLDAVKVIAAMRAQNPFVKIEQFNALDVIKNHHVTASNITVISRYFLVETEVTIEKQHVVLYTLLERNTAQNGKASVVILWQSKGVW